MREIINKLVSIYIDVPVLRPGTVGAYLLAFVSVGIATTLRLAIGPYVEGLQFATFLPAVIITSLISGLGAGLFSVVLSVAAAAFFVLPPHLSFYVEEPGDVLALLLYTVVMLFNVALITGMRSAVEHWRDQQALQASKDRLEVAFDVAQLGCWQYDPRRRVITGDILRRFSMLPLTRCRSRTSRNWCIRMTWKGSWRSVRRRPIPPIQAARRMSTGFSGETARSAG
jgi:uncharacterized protein DUF4118